MIRTNNKFGATIPLTLNLLYSKDEIEYKFFVDILSEKNLIKYHQSSATATLTEAGWARIDEINQGKGPQQNRNVFVAMNFHESMLEIELAICETLKELKYNPIVVKNLEHNDDIVDRIIAEIRGAKFLVADLTNQRQSVYYEAGFARGLNKDVIFMCRKDQIDSNQVHFDINHIQIIPWIDGESLKQKLSERIRATII
jgi:hypothetical protein